MSTLKRENIMCQTNTLFQEKLSDVLYEDSPNLTSGRSFSDKYKAIIDELKHMENELFQQVRNYDLMGIIVHRLSLVIKRTF